MTLLKTAQPTLLPVASEPTATVTLADGYSLVVAGEYVLDANVELVVGGSGGLSEMMVA